MRKVPDQCLDGCPLLAQSLWLARLSRQCRLVVIIGAYLQLFSSHSTKLALLHRVLRRVVFVRGATVFNRERILHVELTRARASVSETCRPTIFHAVLSPETTVTFWIRWATCRLFRLIRHTVRLLSQTVEKQISIATPPRFDIDFVLRKIFIIERGSCRGLLLRFKRSREVKYRFLLQTDLHFLQFILQTVESILDLIPSAICHQIRGNQWPLISVLFDKLM